MYGVRDDSLPHTSIRRARTTPHLALPPALGMPYPTPPKRKKVLSEPANAKEFRVPLSDSKSRFTPSTIETLGLSLSSSRLGLLAAQQHFVYQGPVCGC